MSKLIIISAALILLACNNESYADNHLNDIRCCIEPVRNADGSIKRNRAVVRAFERLYPLPDGHDRSEWQVDHVIPLANGGADVIYNLQWLPKSIKTCAEDYCKDRFERELYAPAQNEKTR